MERAVSELPDAVGQHRIGSKIAWGESQETVGGNEGNPLQLLAVEAGDDGDASSLGVNQSMLGDPNRRACRQRHCQVLSGGESAKSEVGSDIQAV